MKRYIIAANLNQIGVSIVGMKIKVSDLDKVEADIKKASEMKDVKGDEPDEKDLKRMAEMEDKAAGNDYKAMNLAIQMARSIKDVDKAVRRAKAAKMIFKNTNLGSKIYTIFMDVAKRL